MTHTTGQNAPRAAEAAHSRRKGFNAEAFAALWNNPKVLTERIAQAMGMTRAGVSWRARQMGLPSRGHLRHKLHDPVVLTRLWNAGVSTAEIAAHFGMAHPSCASRAALALGLAPRQRGASGKKNGGWPASTPLRDVLETEKALAFQNAVKAEQASVRRAMRAAELAERAA